MAKSTELGLTWYMCEVPIGLSEIFERKLRGSGTCSYMMDGSEDRETV